MDETDTCTTERKTTFFSLLFVKREYTRDIFVAFSPLLFSAAAFQNKICLKHLLTAIPRTCSSAWHS